MTAEIDQSHKIEQTEKDTVVALSNHAKYSLVIRAKEKRKIQQHFRRIGKPKTYVYLAFAALITLLIKNSNYKQKIIIDKEYDGHEKAIADRIETYFQTMSKRNTKPVFEFKSVGKLSPAHELASQIATKKKRPNKYISAEEILKIIFRK